MILGSLVLTHYQRVTDRQTDTPPIAKFHSTIAERDNTTKIYCMPPELGLNLGS